MSHPLLNGVVKSVWTQSRGNAICCLNQVKTTTIRFNKDTFGKIFQLKKHIINRLNGI